MSKPTGYNNATLKQANRGLVFQLVATHDGISRTELACTSKLTKMAVSYIVSEFLERKLVIETDYNGDKKMARKPIILKLSPQAPKIAGLLIHRTHVTAVLCDCQLNVLRLETMTLQDYDRHGLIEAAFRVTDAVMAGQPVLGIGIGSIGPVNIMEGMILNPPDFSGIRDVPIVQLFRARYGIPVYLDYHNNCAAMAEKYFGTGKPYHNFLFLGITEGLGVGIVADDRLYSGFTGFSSEIGHLSIDHHGPQCQCGNRGCVGYYMSFSSEEEIQRSLEDLSVALAGICNLLNPQAVIVGDELARLQDQHLSELEHALNQKLVAKDYLHIRVCRSYRSKDLEASSCAMNVINQVFSGNLLFNS